ncbi:MAG: DUF5060 domain-containing protein [Sedimentisphaerales bacterium]|nr:DUF5060 domain-containing protein [Sedimentisphaerales bacterium]
MNQRNLKTIWLSLTLLVLYGYGLYASDISVTPGSFLIRQFETLTVKIQLNYPFDNPYDPDDIRVDAIIKTPDGRELILPCFYESGSPEKSLWLARFTAMTPGRHSYHIRVVSHQQTTTSKTSQVEVKESNRDGFLRINPRSKYSFLFDSGKRFRGVGLNLCWENTPDQTYTFERYYKALEENNVNFIRIWMCPWNLPLEWTRVVRYQTFNDDFENWDNTFYHSPGLKLVTGKTNVTEDDTNRVLIPPDSSETIIYNIKDIKKFKFKQFFSGEFTDNDIKCSYSPDNISYKPILAELSQTWTTQEGWQRMFVGCIQELPDGTNFLKIEFSGNLNCSPHLASIAIEHGDPDDILDAPGLGRYYQKTAERFDEILRLSEEKGVYIMLAHDYHGTFKPKLDRWGSNDEWRRNPYNVVNGGPCQGPTDYFTHPEAIRYYKNRLRYMVARWGFSPYLACWEFWNEIDNAMDWQNIPPAAIVNWHREMADYLKQIDPYQHLVTTSVVNREVPGLWDIKNLEFTQHHNYGPTDDMKNSILNYTERFHKPDVVGEFAVSWKGPGKDQPDELYETQMHLGLWRGMFSPCPILPLTWWWEWHLDNNHYFHLKNAAQFVALMTKNDQNLIEELIVTVTRKNIETLGLKSGDNFFVWLFNTAEKEVKNLTLTINDAPDKTYIVKYYDTWTGDFNQENQIQARNGQLFLKDIPLNAGRDLAVYLIPEK